MTHQPWVYVPLRALFLVWFSSGLCSFRYLGWLFGFKGVFIIISCRSIRLKSP